MRNKIIKMFFVIFMFAVMQCIFINYSSNTETKISTPYTLGVYEGCIYCHGTDESCVYCNADGTVNYCPACGSTDNHWYVTCTCGTDYCPDTYCEHRNCPKCCSSCNTGSEDTDDNYEACGCCGQDYNSCPCSICEGCWNCTYHYGCTCEDEEEYDDRPSSAEWYLIDAACWRSGSITHNGTSTFSHKVAASGSGTFSFKYRVSSEASYDKLTIKVTHSGGTTTVANAISGEGSWQTYSATLSPTGGYITINATYTKDGSVDNYDDCGYIKEISFTPTHTHSYSTATCSKAATCSCGVTSGSALGHSYTGTLTCNVNGSTDTRKCVRYGKGGCTATRSEICSHNINVTLVAGTGGNVSGSTTCKAGSTVTITATPNTGYKFSSWTTTGGTLTNSTLATTYLKTASSDITATANFTADSYTITYNVNGGSVSAPDSQTKYYGSKLILRTYSGTKPGYTFVGWNRNKDAGSAEWGNGVSMGEYETTSNITLYAVWQKNPSTTYMVKHYKQNLDGTYPATPVETQTFTETIGLTVTPNVKSYDGFTSPNVQSVTIVQGTIVNYYYMRNNYTLTLLKDESIQDVSGGGTYKYGEEVKINVVVKSGYAWTSWISSNVNLINNSTSKEYTFYMPADNITLTAIGETAVYRINTSASVGGRITPSSTVRHGDNKNIIITVNEGYKILNVKINEIEMEIKENYYLENIKEDKNIVVSFVKQAEAPNINKPVVADGMIPVKWNGENWVITSVDDKNWYNYNASEGKWANVMLRDGTKYWSGEYKGSGTLLDVGNSDIALLKGKSIDPANEGSMFVWIPRYTYKISGNTVNIKWSRGGFVDFTTNGYLVHPGFNDASYLGGNASKRWNYNAGNKNNLSYITQSNMLSGIWVAKYEASKDTNNYVQFKSNATSTSNISIGDSYDISKAMLSTNKDHYGLRNTGKTIFKSHLIKNSEWAAASYLYKAIGKDNEYAIKQVNTGLSEYVSTVVEQIGGIANRKAILNGNSIVNGNIKDVDIIRLVSPTDTSANNYSSYAKYKGNAISEVSSAGTGSSTVTGETSILPTVAEPFMIRTGYYGFNKADGAAKSTTGFRTTLLIK